jgi:RNA polymerase sigma-70 factor (ECF subfamily)
LLDHQIALARIAREERRRIERLLRKLLGERPDLNDLTQNVFVECLRALPRFRGDSGLSSFITGVALQIARRARRSNAWTLRRRSLEREPAGQTKDPMGALILREQLERTWVVLDRIAPLKREAFLLWALEGLTVGDIAERTCCSVSATRSRIFYAQKELRARAGRDAVLSAV